jgi:uncharacterized membrane protein
MSTNALDVFALTDPRPARTRFAEKALRHAAAAWVAAAMLGQWIMATYVFALYGGAVARGDAQGWNTVMERGHVDGAPMGNAVVVAHVAFAFVVLAGGALQLVPAIRRRWPALHRWNGRLYLLAVAAMCVGGLVMHFTRARFQTGVFDAALVLNVVLAAAFGWLAWRAARARRFDAHRRWALRTFVVASAQWFFRLALMLWILLNQGPVGFDPETLVGPTITFLAFAQFLLPLAVLEGWLRAQAAGPSAKLAMAGVLGAMTLATAGGIAAASMILWLPRV